MTFARMQMKWMTGVLPLGCALMLACAGGQKKQEPILPPPTTAPDPTPVAATPESTKPVDVALRLDALSATKGAFEMQPGDVLKSGDRMAVTVRVDQPAYVYVTLISGDGSSQRLFPKTGDQQITPAEPLRIPKNPEKWIPLDKSTGQENVFVYAAKKPLQPEEQLNLLNADVASVKAAAAKRAAKAKPSGKPKDAPSHLTADSRGVVLDDDDGVAGAGASEVNGVVKKRFTLQHK
jgi:hypothetical protein